jgi:hypothetical protein
MHFRDLLEGIETLIGMVIVPLSMKNLSYFYASHSTFTEIYA